MCFLEDDVDGETGEVIRVRFSGDFNHISDESAITNEPESDNPQPTSDQLFHDVMEDAEDRALLYRRR